jgi:hypothetical protein
MIARDARRLEPSEADEPRTDDFSRPTDDELNVRFLSDLLLIEQRRNAFFFSYPAFCYWWG